MSKPLLLLFFSILYVPFTFFNDVQKKTIRNGAFDIDCYVLIEDSKVACDIDKTYYWFKAGEIHTSQSSAGGKLLHDRYVKYFRSNQMAENGSFHYGLKDGTWKTWYKNGQLKTFVEWHKGAKNGKYTTFDDLGNELEKGKYKNNVKSGQWINVKEKDTLVYKKGTIFLPEENTKEKKGFKRLFKKKSKTKSNTKNNTAKKPGFFKRLFSKKKTSKPNKIKSKQ